MKSDGSTVSDTADVVSEPLVYPGRTGLKIAAFWDHGSNGGEGCPFVILAPKYGETKKNNLQLAYQLAANGLNVLRFDHTCHVGESDGERLKFTLPGAVDDMLASLDYLQAHHGVSSAGLIGSSLSARMALRAAAIDPRVAFFVSVVGVVNFRRTIHAVNGEDTLGAYLDGRKRGVADVLGIDVDFEYFQEAVFVHNLQDLEGTLADARKLKIPAVFFAAGNDVWVEIEDVRKVAAAIPGAKLHVTEGVMHEVRENPGLSERLFEEIVSSCVQLAYGSREKPARVFRPPRAALLRQNRLERMRLRHAISVERDETVFWSHYLRKFDYIQNGEVYRRYLDLVVDLVGEIPAGGAVLDAGCGNGFAGVCYQQRVGGSLGPGCDGMPMWLSVDLTASGLGDAMNNHFASLDRSAGTSLENRPCPLDFGYAVTDLDTGPGTAPAGLGWLGPGTFDAVVASLVVSYLREPARVIAEFCRVLKPGGRIVVSSMKPNCDLSLIYRTFIEQVHDPERLEPARDLLRAAGAIRIKEDLGYYRFFAADELMEMLAQAGFRHVMPFMSLADQAVVVRAEK